MCLATDGLTRQFINRFDPTPKNKMIVKNLDIFDRNRFLNVCSLYVKYNFLTCINLFFDKSALLIVFVLSFSFFSYSQTEIIPIFKNGKWAAVDTNLVHVTAFKYDYLESVNKKYLIAKKNGKYGLLDQNGETAIDFKYEDISNHEDKYLIVVKGGTYGIVDYSGNIIVESKYSNIKIKDSTFAILSKNGKHSYYKFKTQEHSGQFDYIKISNGHICILGKDEKLSLLDLKKGYSSGYYSEITQKNNHIFFCEDSLANKYIIDGFNNYSVVKTDGFKFFELRTGMYAYRVDEKLQLTDEHTMARKRIDAQDITPPFELRSRGNSMSSFISGDKFLYFKNKGKIGVLTDGFRKIIEAEYDRVNTYKRNFIVWKGDKKGKISQSGQVLFPAEYTQFFTSGNYWVVRNENGAGICNADYKLIIKPQYESITAVGDNLFLFTKNSKKGIVDASNKTIIPAEYNSIIVESNGFIVWKNNKCGLINPKGRILVKPKYNNIRKLNNKHFAFVHKEKTGVLNANGKIVVKPEYNTITATNNYNIFYIGNFDYEHSTKAQLINRFNLDIPIPKPEKDIIRKRFKTGLINTFGQIILEPKYFSLQISDDIIGNIMTVKEKSSVLVISFENDGRLIEKIRYKNYIAIKKGRKIVRKNYWRRGGEDNLWGLFSYRGAKLINYRYTRLQKNFLNDSNLVKTRVGRKTYGIVNQRNGKVLLPASYKKIYIEDFDIAPVARCFSRSGRVRLINSSGVAVGKGFGYVDNFKDGYVRVNKGGRLKKTCDFKHRVYINQKHKFLKPSCITDDPKWYTCQKGKWGVFDTTASYIIEPKYDFLQKYFRGVFIAELDNKWGVVLPDDSVIVDFKYDEIRHFNNDSLKYLWQAIPYFKVRLKNKWGVIDSAGNQVVESVFDDVEYFGQADKIYFKTIIDFKTTTFGVINKDGKIVLEPKYLEIGEFKNGFARVKIKRRCWNYIDTNMKQLSAECFVKVRNFKENAAAVQSPKGWGHINESGQFIIPAAYSDIGDFNEGLVKVKHYKPAKLFGLIRGKRYYVIMDKQGDVVLNTKTPKCGNVNRGLLVVGKRRKYQVITIKGKRILPSKFRQIIEYPEYGLYQVNNKKRQTALYNHKAELLVPFGKYKKINKFSEGLSYVEGEESGFIDTNGFMKLKVGYKKVNMFSGGLAAVMGKKAWGYINKNAKVVIPFQFYKAGDFKNGVASVVNKQGKHYSIDKQAKILHKVLNRAGQDLFYIKSGKYVGIATKANNFFALPVADVFNTFSEDFAAFGVRKLYGIYNSEGKQLAKPSYIRLEKTSNNLLKLTNVEEIKYVK